MNEIQKATEEEIRKAMEWLGKELDWLVEAKSHVGQLIDQYLAERMGR